MNKKTTSIKVDPELWKKVKKYCIDLDLEVSGYVENVLRCDLENSKKNK